MNLTFAHLKINLFIRRDRPEGLADSLHGKGKFGYGCSGFTHYDFSHDAERFAASRFTPRRREVF